MTHFIPQNHNQMSGFGSHLHEDINDDDLMHDRVQDEIRRVTESVVRTVTPSMLKTLRSEPLSLLSIEPITGEFACSICKDFVTEPMVIKHCLHFFCKDCIDKNILRL